MSHAIRRKDRAITEEEARSLLNSCEYGTLATVSADGQPYATPISYIVMNGTIYVHCAKMGHKLDNIAANPAVSFAVVGKTQPVFENNFSTYYESAVVFGKARHVTDEKEKWDSLMALAEKYLPDHMEHAEKYIQGSFAATTVIAISMDTVTGKAKKKKA